MWSSQAEIPYSATAQNGPCVVVLACCVLHNMAEYFKDDVPPRGRVPAHLLDDADDNDDEEEDNNDDGRNAQVVWARAHRDRYLCQQLLPGLPPEPPWLLIFFGTYFEN